MTASLEKEAPDILQWFNDAAPVRRMGVPEDLTPIVCFLLSDAGSFTTGADFVITGMAHAPNSPGEHDFALTPTQVASTRVGMIT